MNDGGETLRSFLGTEISQSSVASIAIYLVLAALLGWGIARFYVLYGTSISNRRAFSRNFVLLTMSTTLIITLIRNEPLLSLGMIGALSIVRFRSAIKEPEELTYLFLSVAVGMGLGAGQPQVTIGGLLIILFVLWLKAKLDKNTPAGSEQNMFLTVSTARPDLVSASALSSLLNDSCSLHRLKRLDQTKESTEACYIVEPKDTESLQTFEVELRKLDENVSVSLLDTRGGMMGVG